ncbi:MAG: phosphate ABC transporter substrate-binding protein PstS [Bordetella sp.]|nr:MAG: phosphate ABC transporter substrate-binding protein PstS [Bordetella sp.]
MFKYSFTKILVFHALLMHVCCIANALNITGAGASFPYPIYTKWAADYKIDTNRLVNYQSIGSGGGKQQIIAKTIDFGAVDDPMDPDFLKENGLFQFPAVLGGTVAIVNIDGVKAGELKLSGEVLTDIFLGSIKKWNDQAIKALNPDIVFPEVDIIVVHRADGSGTTFNWTNYLSKVSPIWKKQVGEGKSVKWPTGQGGKGNEGVAAYVSQLKNSIGYVEYTYAKKNNLAWTQLKNKAGKFVQPEQQTFSAAAKNADWKSAPGMGIILTNESGAESWPITSASFIVVHKQQENPNQGHAVLEFFDWVFKNGTKSAKDLDYVPLPDFITNRIRESWFEITGIDKKSIWNSNITKIS